LRLFDLIHAATIEGDSDTIWEIILKFEPFIRKTCINPKSGEIDEDLMSFIYTKLYQRIYNFDIFQREEVWYIHNT